MGHHCKSCGRAIYRDGEVLVHERYLDGPPYTACGGPSAPVSMQRIPALIGHVAAVDDLVEEMMQTKPYTVSYVVELNAPSAQLAAEMAVVVMRENDESRVRVTDGARSTFWVVGPDGAATKEA